LSRAVLLLLVLVLFSVVLVLVWVPVPVSLRWRSLRWAGWVLPACCPLAAAADGPACSARPTSMAAKMIEPRILTVPLLGAVAALADDSPSKRGLSCFLYFV